MLEEMHLLTFPRSSHYEELFGNRILTLSNGHLVKYLSTLLEVTFFHLATVYYRTKDPFYQIPLAMASSRKRDL
jgi:hypothetical protein